ncbi:MAG: hypothetical protein R2941_02295 [Desulfobacterales bacterium]
MKIHVPELLSRYRISCCVEDRCIEYVLTDRISGEDISHELLFSLNLFSGQIHVSKFYPEIYKQPSPKYLSAACFYLLIHHFARSFHLERDFPIFLQTRISVFHHFYALLKDFDFQICRVHPGDNVDLCSRYCPRQVDISMITQRSVSLPDRFSGK